MLVITRGLVKQLEAEVFDQYTEGNKTRIDDRTPEEMRWLVLYPMLPRSVLGALRERFAALSNVPAASAQWIEGALAEQLAASSRWLDGDTPLAMVVQRSRFVLRVEAAQPSAALVQAAVELGVVAAAAARRVADEVARGVMGSGRPSHWGAPSAMPPQRNESS